MKKFITILLAFALALAAFGCAAPAKEPTEPAVPAEEAAPVEETTPAEETSPAEEEVVRENMYVSLATGPNSSTHYMALSCIANIVSKKYPNYSFNPEITTGGTENIRLISAGTSVIGMAQADAMVAGYNGEREFDDTTKGKINFVMGTFITCFHQFTTEDSDINTFTDLKGKKCGVANGTMAQVFWDLLLKYHGMTRDDVETVNLAFGDIVNGVIDGTLDYGIHICGYPNSQLTDMSLTNGVKMLSFDPAFTDKMIADMPYLGYTTIPADVYGNEAYTLSTRNIMICAADAPEQLIYDFLKATLENPDELAALGSAAAQFNTENALDYSDLIPIHPGALKYYKEVGLIAE